MPDAPAPQPSAANARHRVPRWVWFVVTCVALGAMTSVGVAWGLAWKHPALAPHGNKDFACGRAEGSADVIAWTVETWYVVGYSRTRLGTTDMDAQETWASYMTKLGEDPDEKFRRMTADAACQRAIKRHAPLISKTDRFGIDFATHRYGWPFACFGCEEAFSRSDALALKAFRDGRFPSHTPVVIDPVFNLRACYSAFKVDKALLPLLPLWPGLLANTAIYGGAWAVLIGGPILLRRWLRARRGGCPQCGYSREGLKVNAPCPECGRTNATIASSSSTSTTSESHDGPSRPKGPRDLSHD